MSWTPPIAPRKHPGDLNSFESTGAISTGSKYNNKIQDGLDDLIAGATGIRRSKIKAIQQSSNKFRAQDVYGSYRMRFLQGGGGISCTTTPALNETIQFPESVTAEDGTQLEFPNYIHFRSLDRRAKQDNDFRWDIFLYVPDTLNDNLAVTYTEADLGIVESLISNFVKTDQVEEGWGVDRQEMVTNMISMTGGIGKMIQSAQGRGVNPLKYQLFEGVAFRTFNYTFTLRPKNKKEAGDIQRMLYVFKREALPGVAGSNSRIYTFPTEWSIQFVGPIKEWVDFPLVSVLTGVNVDYAGGQPLALMEDGSPSVVTLTLSFMETTQLNRQKFDNWVSSYYNPNGGRDLESVEQGTNINRQMVQGALMRPLADDPTTGLSSQGGPAAARIGFGGHGHGLTVVESNPEDNDNDELIGGITDITDDQFKMLQTGYTGGYQGWPHTPGIDDEAVRKAVELKAAQDRNVPFYVDDDGEVQYGIPKPGAPQTHDELLHATFPNLTQGSNDDGSGVIEKTLGTTTTVTTSGDTISKAEQISNFEEGAGLGSGQPPSGSTKTVTTTTVSGTGTNTSQYVNGVFVGENRTPHGSNDVVDTRTNFEQPANIPSYSDLNGPAPSKIRFRAYNNYISAQFAYEMNRSAKIEQMNQSRNQGQQETGGNGG